MCRSCRYALADSCQQRNDFAQSTLQVVKDPSDPTGPVYIQPTGAPKALVIQRDISAAAGKIHVVQGPLVPASLVSIDWFVDVLTSSLHYSAYVDAVSLHADGVSWERVHASVSTQLWVA